MTQKTVLAEIDALDPTNKGTSKKIRFESSKGPKIEDIQTLHRPHRKSVSYIENPLATQKTCIAYRRPDSCTEGPHCSQKTCIEYRKHRIYRHLRIIYRSPLTHRRPQAPQKAVKSIEVRVTYRKLSYVKTRMIFRKPT